MEDKTINIELTWDGLHYKGWATPSEHKNDNGKPRSFHVVLNDTMFGNLSWNKEKWTADEQRPEGMVEAVGHIIQSNWK